jgi:hypothetical protein
MGRVALGGFDGVSDDRSRRIGQKFKPLRSARSAASGRAVEMPARVASCPGIVYGSSPGPGRRRPHKGVPGAIAAWSLTVTGD